MLHSIDENGYLVSVSDKWLRVLGYARDEVIGHRSTEFLTEESRRYAIEVILPDYLARGYCTDVPYQMVCKDGSIVDVLLSATSECDDDGNFIRSIAAISDVTEQRRAEKAREKSEARFRDIAEAVSDWIWETDDRLRVTYISSRFAEATGMSSSDFIGRPMDCLFVRPTTWTGHRQVISFEDHEPFREQLFEICADTIKPSIVSVSAWPLIDDRRNFLGYRGVGSDMTERIEVVRLGEALDRERERNEAQRQFVSMVSHEFRTPLSIIDGNARRLARPADKIDQADREKLAEKVNNAVKRLVRLIDTTINAARLEAGKVNYNPKPCNLAELIADIAMQQQETIPHRISLALDEVSASIEADPKLLDHVFTNLIANASKYSPDQPEIWVRGRIEGEWVVIEIEDRGVGIPANEVSNLFRRFFRATTSAGFVGTGLGLHIAKQFVELHKGEIDVTSSEGQGTVIAVKLPVLCPSHLTESSSDTERAA